MTSFYIHARNFPPVLVRLLARRRNGPPLTTAEIVSGSGLDWYTVNAISFALSWDNIPFSQMERFIKACDCDFTSRTAMNRKACYMKLRGHRFLYLRKSSEFETVLRPLVERWRAHIGSKINQ